MTRLPLRTWATAICLLVAAAFALAAPTTPETPNPQEDSGDDATAESSRIRGQAGAAETRAVDFLIEMQPRAAGLAFMDKARKRSQPGNPSDRLALPTQPRHPARVAETPPTSKAGLFGSGATPTLQARMATRSDPVAVAPDTFASPRRGAAAGNGEALPSWLFLPREIIECLRENRGFVLACVAASLALFWAVSTLVSRRRP
jgi:hypothetical protein